MKISELYGEPRKTKKAFQYNADNFIDSGYQAQVYQHPRDPNKVIKTVDMGNTGADSYLDFIRLVMDHQDNIYFPRIFNAKVYQKHESEDRGDYGEYRIVIVMEKLHSIRNHKLEKAAIAAFRNIGIPENVAASSLNNPRDLSTYIEYHYDDTVASSKSHMDEFVEAYKLLQPYIDEYGQDMHSKNFMLRLTSTGPQLVIIDPLAPSSI